MTEKEKRTILDMRAAGRQYKEISAELGIRTSRSWVSSFRMAKEMRHSCERRVGRKTGICVINFHYSLVLHCMQTIQSSLKNST